jgi:NAD(P)-dependent dehydrogenase (short-subunit alcohol dehydrogenase family)
MRGLRGRKALVTGGARGLGAAAVTRLAEEGVDLAILDRSDASAAIESARRHGVRAEAFSADVRDEAAVGAAVAAAAERLGGLHVLVNNAGVLAPRIPFEELTRADFARYLDINVLGTFVVTKAAALHLRAGGAGRIINVASRTFFMGNPGQSGYVASKGGIIGLTRSLARELGPDAITVNAVMPGMVPTEGTRANNAEPVFAEVAKRQAIDRIVEPADLAALIAFLASDDAAMITGQAIVCDGGGYLH